VSSDRKTEHANCFFGTDDEESSLKYRAVLNIFLRAKIDAKLSDRISEALWKKYLLMCPLGSLTAATGKTYGALLADPTLKIKLRGMMEEVTAVAKARNVHLSENAIDRTMEMAGRFAFDAKTSMQLDKEKGRPTEVDTLTGFLCRAGRESGIPTPLHDEVYQQIIR
jgi:2-dehydropantoate 2-reductase